MADLGDVVTEGRLLKGRPRVAPRLLQLGDNIFKRRFTDCFGDVALQWNGINQRRIAHQLLQFNVEVGCHFSDERITFRVYRRGVEWIGRTANAEEAGRLLKSLGTE